jgi:hypothetical protein
LTFDVRDTSDGQYFRPFAKKLHLATFETAFFSTKYIWQTIVEAQRPQDAFFSRKVARFLSQHPAWKQKVSICLKKMHLETDRPCSKRQKMHLVTKSDRRFTKRWILCTNVVLDP